MKRDNITYSIAIFNISAGMKNKHPLTNPPRMPIQCDNQRLPIINTAKCAKNNLLNRYDTAEQSSNFSTMNGIKQKLNTYPHVNGLKLHENAVNNPRPINATCRLKNELHRTTANVCKVNGTGKNGIRTFDAIAIKHATTIEQIPHRKLISELLRSILAV